MHISNGSRCMKRKSRRAAPSSRSISISSLSVLFRSPCRNRRRRRSRRSRSASGRRSSSGNTISGIRQRRLRKQRRSKKRKHSNCVQLGHRFQAQWNHWQRDGSREKSLLPFSVDLAVWTEGVKSRQKRHLPFACSSARSHNHGFLPPCLSSIQTTDGSDGATSRTTFPFGRLSGANIRTTLER